MVKPRTEPARSSNTTRFIVVVLFAAAVTILFVQFGARRDPHSGFTQSIHTREVVWTCKGSPGHQFKNRFRFEPLPCRTCDSVCFIQLDYHCPVHDSPFTVLVEFERPIEPSDSSNDQDRATIARYCHMNNVVWQPSDGTVHCEAPGCKTAAHRRKHAWSNTKIPKRTPE